jgi:hypothetical protein
MLTDPRHLIASLILPLWLLVLPSAAVAQTGAQKPLSMDRPLAASALVSPPALALERPSLSVRVLTGRAQQPPRGGSRDSLKNGTLIGAIVGAVALGGFGAVVCKVQQEPGGPSCLTDTLRVAALGAAIGAGAGLAVDVARTQRGGVRGSVAIRF